jgi:endothelin-converting enzyme/putative endopeptidase
MVNSGLPRVYRGHKRAPMRTTLPVALFLVSCAPKPAPVAEVPAAPPPPPPPAWATDLLSSMDPKVDACSDFYAYACGGWMAATPLPADKPRWTRSFSVINDQNLDLLKTIVEEAAANPGAHDADWQKMGDTYGACMDEAAVDAAGVTPLAPVFAAIDKVKDLKGFMRTAGDLQQIGVDALVRVDVEGDFKNPDLNVLYIGQSGLGLPDRDYYFPADDTGKALLADYQVHVGKMLVLSGLAEADATKAAAEIVAFETKLAEAEVPRAELRDPEKGYNRVDRAGLLKLTPKLDWAGWLDAIGVPTATEINVDRPDTYKKFEALLKATPVATLRSYLRFHAISTMAPNLSAPVFQEDFGFFQAKVVGRKEPEPRWKRCLAVVNRSVGEVAGRYYVEKAFPGESKEVASSMLGDIQAAFVAGLPNLAWMDDATRERAKEKAGKIKKKIGYPDAWRDYSTLTAVRTNHAGNVMAGARFEHRRNMVKVGKPVDKGEWYMVPQLVNAYYNPLNNEFAYPAGILQAPFFSKSFPAARNYGGIGAVMGHELSHGFDDQGRKFDGDGKMSEWWAPEVSARFEAQAKCVVDEFNGFKLDDGTPVKGDLTLGENIGDLGGVRTAFRAFQATAGAKEPTGIPGMSQAQVFFVAYAQNWCTVASPEYQRMQVASDPHSPAKFRVIGPLQNLPEFHEAFGCAEGTPMRPANRCEVW